ncbi:LuxR C-terminal-related transcriptional regulator [Geodermatophilus sp. SYSU D00766]
MPVPRRPPGPVIRTPAPVLNGRDLELLSCLASGGSTAQVATVLAVSSNTARTRIRRVEHKLRVEDRGAAVRAARDLGALTDGPAGSHG